MLATGMAVNLKSLDFPPLSEFLVGTGMVDETIRLFCVPNIV